MDEIKYYTSYGGVVTCPLCGANVGQQMVHTEWHQQMWYILNQLNQATSRSLPPT